MPLADAFAILSTCAVVHFGVVGLIWPRVGGAVLLFATLGLTSSAGVRVWITLSFAGGLMQLWFGRRNRPRGQMIRKLVRVTVLAGAAARMITAISR